MAPRRTVLAALVVLALAVPSACTPTDLARSGCLDASRPLVDAPDSSYARWPASTLSLPDHTTIDARGSMFVNTDPDPSGWRVGIKFFYRSDSRRDLCLLGGLVLTELDPEQTPFETWHQVTALNVATPDFHLVGTRFFNQGDVVSFGDTADDWRVTGVRVDGGDQYPGGYIHDDCIENDSMHSGIVDDSKFDGCHIFLSSFSPQQADGSANQVEVRNTLVRLRPYEQSWNVPVYGTGHHGGFFKWSWEPEVGGVAPSLYVHDSVFRADQPAYYGGNANGILALPPGTQCHDVTLVNSHLWPADDLASWTSQCTNLVLGGPSDWDDAVAEWDANHPPL